MLAMAIEPSERPVSRHELRRRGLQQGVVAHVWFEDVLRQNAGERVRLTFNWLIADGEHPNTAIGERDTIAIGVWRKKGRQEQEIHRTIRAGLSSAFRYD